MDLRTRESQCCRLPNATFHSTAKPGSSSRSGTLRQLEPPSQRRSPGGEVRGARIEAGWALAPPRACSGACRPGRQLGPSGPALPRGPRSPRTWHGNRDDSPAARRERPSPPRGLRKTDTELSVSGSTASEGVFIQTFRREVEKPKDSGEEEVF